MLLMVIEFRNCPFTLKMSRSSSSSGESMESENDDYQEIKHYDRHIKKFHTDQHITKFILRNMHEYPEYRFMEILENLIDRAYENSKKKGENPIMFQMILDGTGLETPIVIPLRSREQNSVELILNEIDMLEVGC